MALSSSVGRFLRAPQPSSLNHSPSQAIAIVGAGAVGTGMAVMLSQRFEQRNSSSRQCIHLIDELPPGAGLPFRAYSQNADLAALYLMNQPNDRAGFDPDDMLAFCRFLNPVDPESVRDQFSPRVVFGQFMEAQYQQASKNLNSVTLNHIPERLTGLQTRPAAHPAHATERLPRSLLLQMRDQEIDADLTVLATGHQPGSHLRHHFGERGFFSAPCDIDKLRAHLDDETHGYQRPVLIVGSGQSCIDAIAVLDGIGFRGKIQVASRSPFEFWAYHPEDNSLESEHKPYKCQVLVKTRFAAREGVGAPWSAERLDYLLTLELDRSQGLGFGPMNLLQRVLHMQLLRPGLDEGASSLKEQNEIKSFLLHVEKKMSNGIPVSRLGLLHQLEDSGQLQFVIASVGETSLLQSDTGFYCCEQGLDQEEYVAVINAAYFSREALIHGKAVSPLMREFQDNGLLLPNLNDQRYFRPGVQQHEGVYIAAGPQTSRRWVLDEYRDKNKEIVDELVCISS